MKATILNVTFPQVSEPWEIVGMDLVEKLTPTEGGYQYICVMVYYFTKWCEAFLLKSKSKGRSRAVLLTDQGTEFVNKVRVIFIALFLCF